MNYSALYKNLRKEISSACQFKNLEQPFKAFGIVVTIPFWILTYTTICMAYVELFIYNCVASSSSYLEGWVNDMKKNVNPITEAVIYLVAMPTLLFMRVILSIFSVFFFMNWFDLMCFSYIATLASIRWQPFISEAKYEDDVKLVPTTNRIAANTIILISFVALCIAVLSLLFEGYVIAEIFGLIIYFPFMSIAVPIAFRTAIGETSATPASENASVPAAESENDFEEDFAEF